MTDILRCIQLKMNHLKTCRKAGMCGRIYIKTMNAKGTLILDSIRNYPNIIPMETASAIIDSVVDEDDTFDLKTRCEIVESVNTKMNIEISHSTTPSTTVSVCECVFVCACISASMQVPPLW